MAPRMTSKPKAKRGGKAAAANDDSFDDDDLDADSLPTGDAIKAHIASLSGLKAKVSEITGQIGCAAGRARRRRCYRGGARMILGLDLGTKTGACFGAPGDAVSRIECETWALPSGGADDVGPIMAALRDRLDDRLVRGIEVLVFEAPYTARHQVNGRWVEAPNQTRRAYGMAAICEEAAYRRRIRCIEVVTSTLKKEFAGHGRADKAMMIAAARRRGFIVRNDHEADAAACWTHGVLHMWPEHAAKYDPLFVSEAR